MSLGRHIDYTVRAECSREGVDPARFVRVLDHLPRDVLLRPLGLYPADFDLEDEKTEAYNKGVEEGELVLSRAVDAAAETLARLGQTKDVRGLIGRALDELARDPVSRSDADNLAEAMFEAIDEIVAEAERKAARKARAKALARFKAGRARRVAA